MIKVVFPFDAVTQAQLLTIKPRGFWYGPQRGWVFPLEAVFPLRDLLGTRFVINKDVGERLHWLENPLPQLPTHRELIDKAGLNHVLLDGRIPFPHQRGGARWLLARKGALLADEMGLGKTLTVLLAARAMVRGAGVQVMVIAPVGLHAHWRNEAAAVGLEIDLKSWACLPKNLPSVGTLLVVDEAHFAQSLKSKRTKALLNLSRHPCLRAIWLITGTPMRNGRPLELYPLLAAINHPLGQDQRTFEKYFCQGHWRQFRSYFIWDCNGASNLDELRRLVRPLILNRSKQSCIALPPKLRQEHRITLSQSETLGFQHRFSLALEEYLFRVQEGFVKSDAESLVALTALRKISAEFKLPAVNSFVEELIEIGNAVVIFSSFIQPLKLLQNHLGGVLLTGKQSLAQRELAIKSFQNGESNLLLATYGTGGLGYTLNRARHVVFLERPWTPGDLVQAEDRCHRLGMDAPLTSHYFKLGRVDNLVDTLLLNKIDQIDTLLGSKMKSNLSKFLSEELIDLNK